MQLKKFLVVCCILLSFVFPYTVVHAQFLPIGVAGYITFLGGNPVPDGTDVVITNVDNGDSVTVQTGLGTGLFAGTVMGEDGDTVNVTVSVGGQDGSNSSVVDMSLVTNWINVTISSMPPVACFTYSPSNPGVDELVTFHDCSTDQDGVIVSWHWAFGDGGSHSRRDATHSYDEAGTYRVVLTVTDDEGLVGIERKYISVNESSIHIPDFDPPLYPDKPFTVPEMYDLLRANVNSEHEIVIVVIDSGIRSRTYNGVDLSDVISLAHPSYRNGNDEYGHGVFVNYIIQYGIETYSKNVVQYSLRAFDQRGKCSPTTFLECLDIALELDPDIVTVSAGVLGGTPTDKYSQGISKLRNAGIFVTVSAGNNGPLPSTINSPACSPDAIGVGAIDPMQPNGIKTILDLSDDRVTTFSSRGPVEDVYPKPDFTAPGESIIGPWIVGTKVGSGTSLSAPLVAACAVQVIASNKPVLDIVKFIFGKQLYLEIVETSLIESVYEKGDANDYGWGIPNALTAAQKAYDKALYYIIFFIIVIILIIATIVVAVLLLRKRLKS